MLNPDVIRLINQELDGANSAEESRRLGDFLEQNEEARTYARDLKAAVDLFRNAPSPEPGAAFKTKIMAFLQRREAPEAKNALKKSFFSPLFEPLKLKYALFFCLGLALGLLLLLASKFRLINDSGWDTRELAGTVLGDANYEPLDSASWEAAGISQKLEILRGDKILAVGLRGSSDREVVVTLNFAPDQMRFDAVRRLTGDQGGVDIVPGKIILRTYGSHGFLLFFSAPDNPAPSLDVRAVSEGATLFTRTFAWPGGK